MKLLLAPQEFKGSLTAPQAAAAMASGARRVQLDVEIDELPLSDGGSGLVAALVAAAHGATRHVPVSDPLGRTITAGYGLIDRGRTAVVELAAASGLSLLRRGELDPLRASTFGTGQLIRAALDAGIRNFIVGIGGSATNDGGAGIAEALGARFLGAGGRPIGRGGGALNDLEHLDVTGLDPRVGESRIVVACDVRNPLAGPDGAAAVYGPQKGATPRMVETLDCALRRYAEVLGRDLGQNVAEVPGAGAAGGAGAGLMAFLHAELRPGFDLVAEATHLPVRLRRSDLVITGEGRLDRQTAYGKTVGGVAAVAKESGVPVIALVGSLEDGPALERRLGLAAVFSVVPGPVNLDDAMAHAAGYLSARTEAVLQTVLTGVSLALPPARGR